MAIVENYTTKISAIRTASEIQELLAQHGVERIGLTYAAGKPAGVAFEVQTDVGAHAYQLPIDVDAMHQLLRAEKRAGRLPGITVPQAESREHAERVAWRVVAEWLRAQLTLIASRMATLDQVMLPYQVVGGRSMYAAIREQQLRELTGGGDR